jgi:hypothetical protein
MGGSPALMWQSDAPSLAENVSSFEISMKTAP